MFRFVTHWKIFLLQLVGLETNLWNLTVVKTNETIRKSHWTNVTSTVTGSTWARKKKKSIARNLLSVNTTSFIYPSWMKPNRVVCVCVCMGGVPSALEKLTVLSPSRNHFQITKGPSNLNFSCLMITSLFTYQLRQNLNQMNSQWQEKDSLHDFITEMRQISHCPPLSQHNTLS